MFIYFCYKTWVAIVLLRSWNPQECGAPLKVPCIPMDFNLGYESLWVCNSPCFCVITAPLSVQYVLIPCMGSVLAVTGVVLNNPACTVPMWNPRFWIWVPASMSLCIGFVISETDIVGLVFQSLCQWWSPYICMYITADFLCSVTLMFSRDMLVCHFGIFAHITGLGFRVCIKCYTGDQAFGYKAFGSIWPHVAVQVHYCECICTSCYEWMVMDCSTVLNFVQATLEWNVSDGVSGAISNCACPTLECPSWVPGRVNVPDHYQSYHNVRCI